MRRKLLKGFAVAAMTLLAAGVNAQETHVVLPTVDTHVGKGVNKSFGSADQMEIYTYVDADAGKDVDYVGLLSFIFASPDDGMRVKSAKLRLVTERVKGKRPMNVYAFSGAVANDVQYGDVSAAISDARSKSPVATFEVKGQGGVSTAYDPHKVNDSSKDVSAWTNEIDLTRYVQSLSGNSFSILVTKADNENQQTKFYTSEVQDIDGTKDGVTYYSFSRADLVPQLTVEYEEAPADGQARVYATVDGWITDGGQNYTGEIELKNQLYEDNGEQKTDRFFGVLHFDLPQSPDGKQLSGASLRLVTERVKNNRTTDVYLLDTEVTEGKGYADMADAIAAAFAGEKLASFDMVGNNNSIRIDDQAKDEYKAIEAWTNIIPLDIAQLNGKTTLNLMLDAPVLRNGKNDSNRFFNSEASSFTNEKIGLTVDADKLVPMLTLTYDDQIPSGVQGIEVRSASAAEGIFTLSGQRVAKAVRGIYVVNGKKVIVK
jgi:hypothetical protein